MIFLKKIKYLFILSILFIPLGFVFASVTNGSIDSTYKYAWSENIGWINFGCSNCNVSVTDIEITGYAWSDNYGWINLNPATAGVKNDGEGHLSGYAWGENTGWIDFTGVVINSDGYFTGYAMGNITGKISFNCSNTNSCNNSDFKVRTDWRPRSIRPACNNTFDDDGDGRIDYPNDFGCTSLTDNDEYDGGASTPPPTSVGSGKSVAVIGIGESKSGYKITTSGNNFLVYINSSWGFNLENNTEKHVAKIINLDTSTGRMQIQISSQKILLSMLPGESKTVDLDNDGIDDLKIIYNKIKINQIDLTFIKLNSQNKIPIFEESNEPRRFSDGKLVKEKGKPAVYLIENGKKRPIFNEETFFAKGFTWDQVIEVDSLADYPLGEVIIVEKNIEKPIKKEVKDIGQNVDKPEKQSLAKYKFTRFLTIGSRGEDVRQLQKFLNQNGFILADKGPGSPGNETDFFGRLTRNALIKFQKHYTEQILKPAGFKGIGFFGQFTKKFINAILSGNIDIKKQNLEKDQNNNPVPEKEVLQKQIFVNKEKISAVFKYGMGLGSLGERVRRLQKLLASLPDIYPEKRITGYFGPLTQKAVQRFQLKYNVVKSKNEKGFGYVGPKTRQKLLEIFGK